MLRVTFNESNDPALTLRTVDVVGCTDAAGIIDVLHGAKIIDQNTVVNASATFSSDAARVLLLIEYAETS